MKEEIRERKEICRWQHSWRGNTPCVVVKLACQNSCRGSIVDVGYNWRGIRINVVR